MFPGASTCSRRLVDEAVEQAGLDGANGPVAEVAVLRMAGVDFPAEEDALHAVVSERGWARRTSVGNDTFAVLRAGTERGWGVAVVCGAGINCVGVAPDGRQVRFPALGEITGDWGGGYHVGMAAVSAAARSEDGRGPRTSLKHSVPAHFGLSRAARAGRGDPQQRITRRRVIELAVGSCSPRLPTTPSLRASSTRLAGEVVALARAALTRLELTQEPVEVVLGGGLLQAADGPLSGKVAAGLAEVGPHITVRPAASAPVVGAALLGLDELAATSEAQERLRRDSPEPTTNRPWRTAADG